MLLFILAVLLRRILNWAFRHLLARFEIHFGSIRSPKRYQSEVHQHHQERLNNPMFGIHGGTPGFELDFIAGLRDTSVPVAGSREAMKYLHSKYKVYVVSNASNLQQSTRLGKAGLMQYVDGIFGSLDIGYNKPSREYFDYCFSQLGGTTPDQTVIVGDSLNADISGGQAYGLHTIWFNIRGVEASAQITPDHTIHSLSEIPSVL